jgi:hypothetical protein
MVEVDVAVLETESKLWGGADNFDWSTRNLNLALVATSPFHPKLVKYLRKQ